MEICFTGKERAFYDEVEAVLQNILPPDWPDRLIAWPGDYSPYGFDSEESYNIALRFREKAIEKGWLTMSWPKEYGGTGGDFIDLTILIEAMGEACLPVPFFSTVVIAGAALLLSEAERLKKELLPQIAGGEIDVGSSRYVTNLAAWKISQGLPAAKEAAMAKSYTSAASNRVIKLGHQIHGAVSFCDEHDMHLFLRKCKAASIAFGDAEYHLEKVAQELGL